MITSNLELRMLSGGEEDVGGFEVHV